MPVDLEALEVTHNPAERRFEVWIDGYLSKLDYIQDGKNFVITQASLEYAKEHGLRVIPMCSYAAAYIRRNPEYVELTRQHGDE